MLGWGTFTDVVFGHMADAAQRNLWGGVVVTTSSSIYKLVVCGGTRKMEPVDVKCMQKRCQTRFNHAIWHRMTMFVRTLFSWRLLGLKPSSVIVRN